METYFCIICGSSDISLQYTRCPICGGDKREFIKVNKSINNTNENSKKNIRQNLLSTRLNKYLN